MKVKMYTSPLVYLFLLLTLVTQRALVISVEAPKNGKLPLLAF